MRKFWQRRRENERNEEDLRTYLAKNNMVPTKNRTEPRQDEDSLKQNEDRRRSSEADLKCEEAIMKDKERYGRVRNSLMKYLRAEYGRDVADRALRRVNKRISEGYLREENNKESWQKHAL